MPSDSLIKHAHKAKVAVGLQPHSDIISVSGKLIATMWIYLPGGAVLTRLSEALNTSPWVSDDLIRKPVSASAFARWDKTCSTFVSEEQGSTERIWVEDQMLPTKQQGKIVPGSPIGLKGFAEEHAKKRVKEARKEASFTLPCIAGGCRRRPRMFSILT